MCGVIQVSIDVGSSREGTVSKPDLNLLHGDSFAEKQAGTSMPKIMEADLLEVVLLNHPCEVFCHIIGSEELAGLIDTDVVEVFSTVGLLEESSVHFLLFFFFQQKDLDLRDQRKGSEARFGFEDIFTDWHIFAVYFGFYDLVTDGNGLSCEVDCIPFQTKDFASPQAIVGCNLNGQVEGIFAECFHQSQHFIDSIEGGMVHILLGTVDFLHGILSQDLFLHDSLECFTQDGMIVDDSIRCTPIAKDALIKAINVCCFYIHESEFHGIKVGVDSTVDQITVALVCGCCQGGFGCQKPFVDVRSKRKQCIGMVSLEEFFFFLCDSQSFFFIPLILEPDLVEGFLCLSVAGALDGELGGNPLVLSLTIYLEVQHSIVILISALSLFAAKHRWSKT